MALNFLKSSLDVMKAQEVSLKARLHKKMGGWEPAREDGYVHVSDLTRDSFCPRRYCLCLLTGKKRKGEYVNTSLRATFDLGNALQNNLNQTWGVEWCVGNWKCCHCGAVAELCLKPATCNDCGHKYFQYEEVAVVHPSYGYSGSIDYIYAMSPTVWYLVEVKTIRKEDFKTILAPIAEHRQRTVLYLDLVKQNQGAYKYIQTDKAFVFYICKGYGCKDTSLGDLGIKDGGYSPFKEFQVSYDKALIDPIIDRGRMIQGFMDGGVLPTRICPTSFCKEAKSCPTRLDCWK